jgi:hypothetical protein
MNHVLATPAPRKHTRWIWLLLLTLVIVGGVAAAQLGPQLSNEWEATSLLHVDWQPFRLLPDAVAPPSPDAYLVLRDEFCRTQAALAKSRLVINAAVRNPKVAGLALLRDVPEPVEWLEQNLEVSFPDSAHVMQISLHSSKHKEDLVPLVEVITDAYLEEIVYKETIRRQEQVAFLHEVAHRYEDKVKGIRKSLRSLQEQVGPGDKNVLALKSEQIRIEYKETLQELLRRRAELRTLRLQLKAYDSGPAAEPMVTAAQVNATIDKDPLMMEYNKRALQLEGLIEGIVMPDDQGEVADKDVKHRTPYHDLLEHVQKAADKRRKKLEVSVTARLREAARVDARVKHELLKQKVEFLSDVEKLLVADVERLAQQNKAVPAHALDLIDIQRELEEKEATLKALNKRISVLSVELEAPPRVHKVQEAVLRKKKGK